MGNMTTLQILQGVHDWVLDKIDEETANFITKTVNDLVNYYTKSETYTKAEVQQIVDAIKQFTYEVVQVLPTASASTMNKIYLVPAPKSEDKNVKEEYITIQDGSTYSWEMLGTTSIDLSNYYTKGQTDSAISSALSNALASYTTTADLTTLLAQKQDVIQDLSDIRAGASAGSTAVQPSTLNNAVKDVVAESGVYDVSANNDNTKFESLSALLSSANLNTLIPTDIRKGGMSIKFVRSSDNKYVQYRYISSSTAVADFTNIANWQGIDASPTEGSQNLVESGGVYDEVARLQGEIDTLDEDKADKDKNHELLGAGIANSMRGDEVSTGTFLMREATESGVGQIEDIKGNAFAWNQLYNDSVPTAVTNHKYFLTELDGSTRNKSISTTIAYTADSTERNCIDLTLLGIDSLTTVEEVEAWLAQNIGLKDYYPYNAGELLPVRMTGMKTTGFNGTYEPHWEKLASVPVTTLKGKLNGEGESIVVFPDGLKKVGSVYDEIYVENGVTKAIKRVGSVDLGTLNFGSSGNGRFFFYYPAGFVQGNSGRGNHLACAKYTPTNEGNYNMPNMSIGGSGGADTVCIIKNESCTTTAEMKAAASGVILYSVLATTAYQEYVLDDFEMPVNYKVEDGGTEEVVNPVGEPEGTLTGSAPTLGIRYSVDVLERLEGFVSAKKAQSFTSTEKTQARSNIGAMVDTTIDNAPADGSENLISSGAVLTHGNALDVSVLNADTSTTPATLATYADLSAAIAAVPVANRTGGMSIKFVQSSDNKYVQCRLMTDAWSTVVGNWQGVDDEPAATNNLVKSNGVYKDIQSLSRTEPNYITHKQITSDGTIVDVTANSRFISCHIPAQKGDVIEWSYNNAATNLYLSIYKSDDTPIGTAYSGVNGNGVRTFTLAADDIAYIIGTFVVSSAYTPYIKVNGVTVWTKQEKGRVTLLEERMTSAESDITELHQDIDDNVALIEDEIQPIQEENYIIGKRVNGAISGNGEIIDANNNIIVNKDKIKVKNGDKIRWTYYNTNINHYLGVYSKDGTKLATYSANNDSSGRREITLNYENVAYIIGTYMLGSDASLGIEIEDTSSGTAAWVQLWAPNNGGAIYQDSREVSYQKTDIANLKDKVFVKTNYKENYSWNKNSHTYGGHSQFNACADYIRVRPGDKIDWTIGDTTNASFGLTVFGFDFGVIGDFTAYSATRQIFMPNGAAYIKLCWAKTKLVDGQYVSNDTPLQINGVNVPFVIDYKGMENVIDVVAPPFSNDYGIIGKYYPEEMGYVETILNAKKANRFHFLHISDNHGSNFGYANELLDLCNAKFLVNTGDLVYDQFSDKDLETFQTISLATSTTKPVYLVVGNHDYNKAPSKQAIFDAFIAPTNTHNGTSFDKTYYSVDFANEKVKCIMLDQFDGFADADIATRTMNQLIWGKMSETQIRWFVSELQDAITNNYHVCVFIHAIPCPPDEHLRINDFCDKLKGDTSTLLPFLPQVIDAFIEGSTATFTYDGIDYSFTFASAGHFVAWFGGHTHYDMAGWMKEHTNQFMINICQPFKNNATYFGVYDNDKLGVHFNYVTIDTSMNRLSVYRVGAQKTIFATDRKSFSVIYK